MKMLIVGRSGRGKDKLREILETEYGWKFVKSYSTRKPRYEGEDTHIFITHKEADAISQEDKVAVTHIKNGDDIADEYFATRKQVEECDGYIIDPNGVKMLLASMPDTTFEIAYIASDNEDKVLDMVVKRAKGNTNEIEKFKERCKDEDKQFSEFEQVLTDKTFVYVAVLDKPIVWYKNNVQVVFLISISNNKDDNLKKFYQYTVDFLLNENSLKEA